jgi:cytochrome P450
MAASSTDANRYAALRNQPVHESAAGWVIARPADVVAALASAALTVGVAHEASGAARLLQARMARFSEGAVHGHRRALVQTLLPDPASVEWGAWSRTSAALGDWRGRHDAMELARRVPVAVLADAAGVAPEAIDAVAQLTGELCAALVPAGSGPGTDGAASGDAAATALLAALRGRDDEERAVAAASILFQARDATAGLIGLALSAAAHPPRATAADLVERALRTDPPVQWTSRTAAAAVTIGGVSIRAGARVWILLAMADRGEPWPPATFGGGRHGCPGRLIATALARGVVAAILDGGWRPVPGQAPRYEPRPNLRIPVSVLMERS